MKRSTFRFASLLLQSYLLMRSAANWSGRPSIASMSGMSSLPKVVKIPWLNICFTGFLATMDMLI